MTSVDGAAVEKRWTLSQDCSAEAAASEVPTAMQTKRTRLRRTREEVVSVVVLLSVLSLPWAASGWLVVLRPSASATVTRAIAAAWPSPLGAGADAGVGGVAEVGVVALR